MKQTVSTVFDDLEIGITLHDPETAAVVEANSRLEELYGYSTAELREMTVADYSATDQGYTQQRAERRIQAAAAGEPQTFEWQIKRASGERLWVRVRLARTALDGDDYVLAEIRDHSAWKQHQRELEAERGFIQQSLETIEDPFYMLAPDGSLQRWNPALSTVTGYTDAELAEKHALDLFAEADHEPISDGIATVRETGSAIVEAELLTAAGREIPYEFTGTRLTDSDGDLRGIIGIGRDVSERRERLERLHNQQQAFRRLHQTASTDASFEQKVAELLDFGREYIGVEQGFLTSIDGETQEIVVGVGPNTQLSDGAEAPLSESYCRHTVDPKRDGPLTVLNATEEDWKDDPAYERFGLACYVGAEVVVDGKTTGTVCFADRDPADKALSATQETYVELLTEWIAYELDRAERERKYRRLTERISDAYYAVDTEFTVTFWNDVAEDRMALSSEEIIGENLWVLLPELEGTVVETQFREAMATQKPASCEHYYEPLDYWMSLQIYPDEDGLAIISKDITDRKEYEDRLERSNERLQEFAYILSHDLQEPLRMVSSYVDLLEMELDGQLDDDTREYMAFAVDGAERMRGMIDGLLQYSRVETEGETFSETDVTAVVEGVREDLQLAIEEADAEIVVDSLPTVQSDANQLGQLFQNLVSNAIEHSPTDSQPQTHSATEHDGSKPRIEISAEPTPDGYQFAVSDDGPGIPASEQDDIFGLFDSGRDSDGTGIGLAICERIVSRHNGQIWVESKAGEGSTFRFTIETASPPAGCGNQ